MGHVQDSPVATTMISNECMIYHMKVHIVSYNLGQFFFSKSKIHILTISGPMSIKPAIVFRRTVVERAKPAIKCPFAVGKLPQRVDI